jgi:hypothetical protein
MKSQEIRSTARPRSGRAFAGHRRKIQIGIMTLRENTLSSKRNEIGRVAAPAVLTGWTMNPRSSRNAAGLLCIGDAVTDAATDAAETRHPDAANISDAKFRNEPKFSLFSVHIAQKTNLKRT